ncbi:hydrogenase expression/formation protein HypE [Candidatus Contubernalis alkaliaceticus]|uniref:hydrogenase expression/formation protein HypE n=1 Tax=Candidatus Contubernalis alkaliaceticus TaxID=338645 RepID=UPI001F4BE05A|nr:hydrogenase expression/formation protein HypE [Candidatus Contubernalis alkalaceticus]UNC92294.1 hydrogenase expression/formation protein HypE [Candidatus Contubernalis alkalaceticus]
MSDIIILSHGDGGILTHNLVNDIFLKYFKNPYLIQLTDSVFLNFPGEGKGIVVSTDSFVVSPIFFPGGDIGKLAVCGTVNDLAVSGARPLFLTVGFILEEGLLLSELEEVVVSMARTAEEAGVVIVAGDTKVVEKGHGDKIFINTTGIGTSEEEAVLGYEAVKPGDKIVINGTLGDHGLTVLTRRQELGLGEGLQSDCAPLNGIIQKALKEIKGIKIMRDPTRGGLATTLKEIAVFSRLDFTIFEEQVPVAEEVRSTAEMLGLDPLYLANEGKFITIVESAQADALVQLLREDPLGKEAQIIGKVEDGSGKVYLKTFFGGTKYLHYLAGTPLPRIC